MLPAVLTLDSSGNVIDIEGSVNIIDFLLSADVAKLPLLSAGGNCRCWGMFVVVFIVRNGV